MAIRPVERTDPELIERGALDPAQSGGEEEVLARAVVAHLHHRRDRLVRLHVDEVDDRHALGRAAGVRQLVDLELVDLAPVGEDEQRVLVLAARMCWTASSSRMVTPVTPRPPRCWVR